MFCILVAVTTAAACAPALFTAYFTLDDYRYLHGLRRYASGEGDALWRWMIVENRWDMHWWIPDDTYVRFFRPLMITSYAADHAVWGRSPVGFVATNIVLHVATTLAVAACCRRLLGPGGIGWWIAGLAFGLQYAHFENIYYVAGRASTMSTLAFATAVWVHLATREQTTRRAQLAVAALCFVAFLGKELAALLPVLLLLLDLTVPTEHGPRGLFATVRRQLWMLAGCAVATIAYLAIRTAALGETGPGANVFPYIHWMDREGFWPRTVAIWLQYCAGMTVGPFIETFTQFAGQVYARTEWWQLAVGAIWIHGLLLFGLTDRRGRWLVALFVLSSVPLLPLYSSGRHLYLATIGLAGLTGLCADRLRRRAGLTPRIGLGVVAVAFVLVPGILLGLLLDQLPRERGRPDPGTTLTAYFTSGGFTPIADRPLFVLESPFGWYEMQFARSVLETELDADMPSIGFLSKYRRPYQGKTLKVEGIDDHTIEIHRMGLTILGPERANFDNVHFEAGDRRERPGFTFEVLEARDGRPTRARIRFDRPRSEIDLARFELDGSWRLVRLPL